jgi:diguanylate cyclase (GGDEF)-like protein
MTVGDDQKFEVKPHGAPEPAKAVLTLLTRPSKGKIMIVESDPDLARMLEVRLARDGHEVIVATTGDDALRSASDEQIDVALIDQTPDEVSIFEILSALQERSPQFEGIVVTADATADFVLKALNAGAFDVVTKPIPDLKIVLHKVKKALGKVLAERDRHELARLLHAQTQDIARREVLAVQHGADQPEEEEPTALDLDNMSGVDPLTGLPNRRAAQERFRKETARALRYDRPLCIALASVDHLDSVIERHGSEVADGVLRGIASMFSGMVRDVDFVARRQGGEFLFIFPETPKDSGFIVVERIRQRLAQTSFTESYGLEDAGEFNITASFGVAGLPTDTMNAEILHDAAEAALDRAKDRADTVVLFDATMAQPGE